MKLIKETKERNWYLVREWKTDGGLYARIQQCVWSPLVTDLAPSLHPFYTGYVQKSAGDKKKYYDNNDIVVHGGVTFEGKLEGEDGEWVGFDMAHFGDGDKQDVGIVTEECETLAMQMWTPWLTGPERARMVAAVVLFGWGLVWFEIGFLLMTI